MLNWKKIGLVAATSSALVLSACGDGAENSEALGQSEIELAYVAWDSELAATNVVGTVLEDLGYDVSLTSLDNAVMWQAVANGESDAMVSAWLPLTHGDLYEEYEESLDHLGTNLEGAKIGLVVPSYMDVDSIDGLTDQAGQTITGIEAGAGVVQAAERAVEEYDNLSDWNVQTSSSGAMTTELGSAIDDQDDIVVTGWTPHWKFQEYDLKYLDDPQGTFGEAETIETFARQGLAEEAPAAHSVLSNFNWEVDDMESVMLDIQQGTPEEQAAQNWIDENQDKVNEWTAEAEEMLSGAESE